MLLSELCALNTPLGEAALQAAAACEPEESDFLRHFQRLSRTYPAALARAALEIAILRREAISKFPFAARLYLTRAALEQATSWEIARYRAKRYAGLQQVLDLGCSVGGDTLALAEQVFTIGLDQDPLRLAMAQANATALGLAERTIFCLADLGGALPLRSPASGRIGVFCDPGRRKAGQRVHNLSEYQPPLEIVLGWAADYPALGAKLSPAVDLTELEKRTAGLTYEVEFISLHGELKEAVWWHGPLRSFSRRATLLPGGDTLFGSPDPFADAVRERLIPLGEPGAYLYEPDPAVLRAGLVQHLGSQLGAVQLDPAIAYLSAEQYQTTPFARVWMIEAWFPFSLKRLRAYLQQRSVGLVTVKKRGSPLQPEELIRALRLKGDAERVVFLTHLRGRPIVLVGYPERVNP